MSLFLKDRNDGPGFISTTNWEQEYFSHYLKELKKEKFIKELAKLGLKPDKPKEK